MKKLDTKKSDRELSNVQLEWIAHTYQQNRGIPCEYGMDATEWWGERMVRLDQEQMSLYRMKFEEGMTLREIAVNLGCHHTTVDKKLKNMYDILRRDNKSS